MSLCTRIAGIPQEFVVASCGISKRFSKRTWEQFAYFRLLAAQDIYAIDLPDDMHLFFCFLSPCVLFDHQWTMSHIYRLRGDLLAFGLDPLASLAGVFVELTTRTVEGIGADAFAALEQAYGKKLDNSFELPYSFLATKRAKQVFLDSCLPLSEEALDVRNYESVQALLKQRQSTERLSPLQHRLLKSLDALFHAK